MPEISKYFCFGSYLYFIGVDHHDRHGGISDHIFGHAPEESPVQAFPAMGPHNNQVNFFSLGVLEDLGGGIPGEHFGDAGVKIFFTDPG